MGNDKMREEFEAWATENGMAIHLARGESGLYGSPVTQRYWGCWQTSRAAVVVELPTEYDCCGGTTSYEIREMAIKAVEAAGLKVKP